MNGSPAPVLDRPVWQIAMNFSFTNDPGVPKTKFTNLFYYMPSAPTLVSNANDVFVIFTSTVQAAWNNVLPAGTNLEDCFVRDITKPTNLAVQVANPLVPGVASDIDTSNNAVYIAKKTAVRGRNFRGSWHMGPVCETHIDQQKLTVPATALYVLLNVAFKATTAASVLGITYEPQLLSSSLCDLTANPSILELNPFIGGQVRLNIGTMRRRQQKAEY